MKNYSGEDWLFTAVVIVLSLIAIVLTTALMAWILNEWPRHKKAKP